MWVLATAISGCPADSLFEDWKSAKVPDRKLNLKSGVIGKNEAVFSMQDGCAFDVDVDGSERAGVIHVHADSNTSSTCKKRVPTQLNYQADDDKLRICSDFADGRHICESMIKK